VITKTLVADRGKLTGRWNYRSTSEALSEVEFVNRPHPAGYVRATALGG
jgi:hypothetical protein